MTGNRKRVKHFHEPGDLHELTFSCYEQLPLLAEDTARKQLCESIDRAVTGGAYRLVAFVLMPEHVHLLVDPTSAEPAIDKLLYAIKRPFSHRMKLHFEAVASRWRDRLTVRDRPGKLAFRFWQEGPGYDRNLSGSSAIVAAIDYIHRNPVRRGLVERARDWKWSSCRWYESEKQEIDAVLPTIHGLREALS
jgi:putative transposase